MYSTNDWLRDRYGPSAKEPQRATLFGLDSRGPKACTIYNSYNDPDSGFSYIELREHRAIIDHVVPFHHDVDIFKYIKLAHSARNVGHAIGGWVEEDFGRILQKYSISRHGLHELRYVHGDRASLEKMMARYLELHMYNDLPSNIEQYSVYVDCLAGFKQKMHEQTQETYIAGPKDTRVTLISVALGQPEIKYDALDPHGLGVHNIISWFRPHKQRYEFYGAKSEDWHLARTKLQWQIKLRKLNSRDVMRGRSVFRKNLEQLGIELP